MLIRDVSNIRLPYASCCWTLVAGLLLLAAGNTWYKVEGIGLTI